MKSTMTAISIAMTLAIGLASSPALAQPGLTAPPLAPPRKGPPPTTTSYGLQIFFADAILAAVALGSQRGEPAVALLLTGTVIHALHGRADAAVGSALLRLTLPLLGLMVGVEACNEDPPVSDDPCLKEGFWGFGIGVAVAGSLDYFALAHKPVKKSPARVQPAVGMTGTTSTAGLRFDF